MRLVQKQGGSGAAPTDLSAQNALLSLNGIAPPIFNFPQMAVATVNHGG